MHTTYIYILNVILVHFVKHYTFALISAHIQARIFCIHTFGVYMYLLLLERNTNLIPNHVASMCSHITHSAEDVAPVMFADMLQKAIQSNKRPRTTTATTARFYKTELSNF